MMNEFLAQAYGTAQSTTSQEMEAEKVAEAQLFCKLAADEGIDLSQISDEKVAEMYSAYKQAAEEEAKKEEAKKENKDDDKAKEAQAQFDQVKQAQAKMAEADFLGRQMAHAYVDELKKIAAFTGKSPQVDLKGEPIESLRKTHIHGAPPPHSETSSMSYKLKELGSKLKGHAKNLGETIGKHPGKSALIGAGGLAAAAGAGALAHHVAGGDKGKKKKASPLTEIAAERAVYKVAQAGGDAEDAGEKLDALLTLGVTDDGSKMASAENLDQAAEIRAYELLEMVGYPVNWG